MLKKLLHIQIIREIQYNVIIRPQYLRSINHPGDISVVLNRYPALYIVSGNY